VPAHATFGSPDTAKSSAPTAGPNPHTTYGRGGPYRCLGEHLARLELRVLMRELLPVLPRLEPDGKPVRIRSNFTNGPKRLPGRIR
jgi:cytochrome P450